MEMTQTEPEADSLTLETAAGPLPQGMSALRDSAHMNANALDTAAYISMTLAELKEACVAAGLPKTGPKEKLITFLKNPDLYRKKAARKRKASPAAEEPRESPAEAKELVDRAERPARATGGGPLIVAADDDDDGGAAAAGHARPWSGEAVRLFSATEEVVVEATDEGDRFKGRKTRTVEFSGNMTKTILPSDLKNVPARAAGAPGVFLNHGGGACPICGALRFTSEPGEVNELHDILSIEPFLTDALDARHLAGPAGPVERITVDHVALKVACCQRGHVSGSASLDLRHIGTLGWGLDIPFSCLW